MSLPYFPMFPSDFEAKTSHLTLEEDGAYNRLLRLMWMTNGCSLPDDDAWIMRRMRVDKDTYDRVVLVVIEEFCERRNGRVSNARLTKVFTESADKHKKRVLAGSKGGKAKALNNNNNHSSNAKAKPKQPEPEPEPNIEDTNVSLQVAPANDTSSAVSRYNDAAAKAGWPQVQKMTPNRSKQLRARLKECDGMDGWEIALRKAFDSDFCRGRTSKPWGGFGFDWLVKSANFTKLMEGNYDNRNDNARAGGGISGGRENRPDPALEQISRLAGLR